MFEYLIECGLGSTPGTAAEVLHDGVRQRISPNKLPVGRWVEIIEASHRAGLRSTVTVMFGHIEEPWELAEHMHVVRELQERTGGFTEFVPLSFIPFHTLLGRTHGIEEISREDNLKHTAVFRLALGESVTNLQASWVKMGIDAATEALRWGVNDLGGTLMEESISRMAGSYHGVQARSRRADRRGAPRRAGSRRSATRSTRSSSRTEEADARGRADAPGADRPTPALELRDVEVPAPGPGEVLLKVLANGVCRTDLHVVEGELPDPKLPLIPGHQIVGRVEALGEGVERRRGRRPRRRALARRHGRQRARTAAPGGRTSATRRTFTGYQRDGGYAEYAIARADFVLPIPDGYPDVAGGAAAVRRADRLPGAAARRGRGARAARRGSASTGSAPPRTS